MRVLLHVIRWSGMCAVVGNRPLVATEMILEWWVHWTKERRPSGGACRIPLRLYLRPEAGRLWWQPSESHGLWDQAPLCGVTGSAQSAHARQRWASYFRDKAGSVQRGTRMAEGVKATLSSQDQLKKPRLWVLRRWKVRTWERQDLTAIFNYLQGNQNLGLFWGAPEGRIRTNG